MSETGAYDALDRFLHRMAFASLPIQRDLADIEEKMFARQLSTDDVGPPVFVTSLPRAGTTLVLECIASVSGFATHIYRDMPFLLCPLLWDSISRGFRHKHVDTPRAHGDGMMIGYDTAEAFDEVLWHLFWPDKYNASRISLWQSKDRSAEFEKFLRLHMRKIVALRAPGGRYLSKNNANIARTDLLRTLFPECVILVPFRHPIRQATSLLRQHKNFLDIHNRDPFTKRYMESLGHFEFGQLRRTISFPGFEDASNFDPLGLEYWLRYWIAAFEYLLLKQESGSLVFFGMDTACENPASALTDLADVLKIDATALVAQSPKFRAPSPIADAGDVAREIFDRALDVHGRLLNAALRRA